VDTNRNRKPKIMLGYLSADIEDFFVRNVASAGYEVKAIPYKDLGAILDTASWADAIFLQWDGRGQMGHDLSQRFHTGAGAHRVSSGIYAVTTAKIKIETLNPKASRAIGISAWFEVPTQKDDLLKELSLLIPDQFDDFNPELQSCGLTMLSELPLESLSGKHLVGNIKTAWDERLYRATHVTRIKDEILRSHVTFFHDDDARTNDLKTFLTDVRFKYHDEFTEVTSCMRWIRGHGTDCLVVWYDNKSKSSELLLRMYQENRNFRRIPIIVLHASESDLDLFKNRCPDVFVDRFILFDRNREKFRTALIETFEGLGKEHSRRRLLDEIRATAQDFPPDIQKSLSPQELDAACAEIAKETGKNYWSEAEHLLALARFRDTARFPVAVQSFEKSWNTFDAAITLLIARVSYDKQELTAATQQFFHKFPFLEDLNFDRLVRATIVLAKTNAVEALKKVLLLWWQSKEKFPVAHEFYFAASRWASLSGFASLERALLAKAIKDEPLRADYVEAYGNHLIICDHIAHALQLGEMLLKSDYFPPRRALLMIINAHLKNDDKAAALASVEEILRRWPGDRQAMAMRQKLT
jgi:hypothetical protein